LPNPGWPCGEGSSGWPQFPRRETRSTSRPNISFSSSLSLFADSDFFLLPLARALPKPSHGLEQRGGLRRSTKPALGQTESAVKSLTCP
jgi:hypothetical protein